MVLMSDDVIKLIGKTVDDLIAADLKGDGVTADGKYIRFSSGLSIKANEVTKENGTVSYNYNTHTPLFSTWSDSISAETVINHITKMLEWKCMSANKSDIEEYNKELKEAFREVGQLMINISNS